MLDVRRSTWTLLLPRACLLPVNSILRNKSPVTNFQTNFQLLLSPMLADSSLERHALAQPQAADSQFEDAANRRRWTKHIPIIDWQLELGVIRRQQSRVTIIACKRPWNESAHELRLEVKNFRRSSERKVKHRPCLFKQNFLSPLET